MPSRLVRAAFGALCLIVLSLIGTAPQTAQAAELIMVEEPGCPWCAEWHKQIGPIYPKTDEGKRAPLRTVEIGSKALKDLNLSPRPHFTPTFILIEDGKEVGRIEGYPGEDFFWGLLAQIMQQLPQNAASAPSGQ
ncbi:MAG: thioredoxin family protein [Neomegalonema sp.]|nr:thioredoxin family protein [Neomegalonema sp.]